jgi:hypothetical protein
MRKISILTFGVWLLFSNFSIQNNEQKYISNALISIVRYIEWPDNMKEGNFKIGVFGSFDMYKEVANEAMSRGIQNRNADVINLVNINQVNIAKFHVFILADEKCTDDNLRKALKNLGNTPTLIITNKEGALKNGSGINFMSKNNKFTYELNKANITKNGILVSKQLEQFAYNSEE